MRTTMARRTFLMSLAAAAAAPAPQARATRAAAETVTLAVMGVNGRGAALARQFQGLPGAAVAVLCDPDQRVLRRVNDELSPGTRPALETETDIRRVLERPDIDALVIAAPDHWHGPATLMALEAGKHVYVEKPACHNPAEGEWMVAAAQRTGLVVQVGTQRRSAPPVREALERLWAGEIGRVLFARGWINSNRPSIGHGQTVAPPAELDYTLWQGPAPERPYRDNVIHYHWHWFWDWGTGELGNNGVHALDVIRWGLRASYPERVVCGGGKRHFDDDQETPDTQLVTFDFPEATVSWEHRTWHPRGVENMGFGCAFEGENGTLLMGSSEIRWLDPAGKVLSEHSTTNGEVEHLTAFLAAVRGEGPCPAPIAEGVPSTLLCHLGNIAYRTGRNVQLDPATHQIADDAEQQALWGREYRPGWQPPRG